MARLFAVLNKPTWLAFDVTTGELGGTPTANDILVFNNIQVIVSDRKDGISALPAFNLTVAEPSLANHSPSIYGIPASNASEGIAYSFTPIASDPDNNTLTFSIVNQPAWASFDSATGNLSGIPTTTGLGTTSGIVISVSDGQLTTALPAFSIMANPSINLARVFGVASQGGTYAKTAASRAIDGDCTTANHTTCDANNWWQVALPDSTQITKISIRNINTGWQLRLNGAVVYVTDAPYTTTIPGDADKVAVLTGATTDQITLFTTPRTGAYVIVKNAGTQCLHMAEVEVYGQAAVAPQFDQATYSFQLGWNSTAGTQVGTAKAVDYQLNPIAYSIEGAVPFAIDAQGKLTVNGPLQAGATYTFTVLASDGVNVGSATVTIRTTTQNAVAVALQLGDASNVTVEELLSSGIAQAQSESDYCAAELGKIYPGTVQQMVFPDRSAYLSSNSSRNVPLHVANNNGSAQVYSWMGKKENGTPYAVLGTNVFSFTAINTELKISTLNLFSWLLNKDISIDILSQPLVVLVPNSSDRTALQTWFNANGLSHNWTISSNAALLDSGNYDLYLADVDFSVTNIQKAFAANKPVLVYNNWYHPNDLALAEFDLSWRWYGSQTIGNLASVAEQCSKASTSPQIQAVLSNLEAGMPDFQYEAADCPDNVGTVSCALSQVTDNNGNSVENLFNQGATAIRSQLKALDIAGVNVFSLGDDKRLLKLAVLLADKYRDNIQYPMDKISTDDTTFYCALFADNAVHYAKAR